MSIASNQTLDRGGPNLRQARVEDERREDARRAGRVEMAHPYVPLVRAATLAASSHNTQPWRFALSSGRIDVRPDFTRRCPEVDPDDHHLYASLGCAAENLVWAARAAGHHARVVDEAAKGLCLELEPTVASGFARADAIAHRHCNRAEYDGHALSSTELAKLEAAGHGAGVSLRILTEPAEKEALAELVAEGNRRQFGDAGWRREMQRWMRFSERQARRTGDGLYGPTFGMPRIPSAFGQLVLPLALSAERQNDKDRRHIQSSAAIAIFFSEADDARHWMEAGRCYERLALDATSLGLDTAFINQPVEVPALRAELAAYLGIGARRPDLAIRVGRGPRMPRSFRRPVADVLTPAEV